MYFDFNEPTGRRFSFFAYVRSTVCCGRLFAISSVAESSGSMGKDARFCTRMSGASRHALVFTRHSNYITCRMRTERRWEREQSAVIAYRCILPCGRPPACPHTCLFACLPQPRLLLRPPYAIHFIFYCEDEKTEDNFLSSLTMFRTRI